MNSTIKRATLSLAMPVDCGSLDEPKSGRQDCLSQRVLKLKRRAQLRCFETVTRASQDPP